MPRLPDITGRWFNQRWFVFLVWLTVGGVAVFLVMYNARMESRAKKPMGANSEIITELDAVSVMFRWDANQEPNITGYDFSYGTSTGVYTTTIPTTGTTLSVTLDAGATYYLAVRAKNDVPLTGPYSTELVLPIVVATPTPSPTPTATATVPPASPTVTATATATATSTATATASATIPPASPTATATAVSTPTPSPNFTITVNPQTLIAPPNGGYLVYSIDIARTDFTLPVILSATGLPDGVAMRFNPDPTIAGSNFVIFCGYLPAGNYPFTVTGQSFSVPPITRTGTAALVVNP